jgi:L-aspartate semialdehyde sulfurtransferase ferredoxin
MLFMAAGSFCFFQNVVGELYDRANLPIKECLVEQWRALPAAGIVAWGSKEGGCRFAPGTRRGSHASSLKVSLITLASSHSRSSQLPE